MKSWMTCTCLHPVPWSSEECLVNNFYIAILQVPFSISALPWFCKPGYTHIFLFVLVKEGTWTGCLATIFLHAFAYICVLLLVEISWSVLGCLKSLLHLNWWAIAVVKYGEKTGRSFLSLYVSYLVKILWLTNYTIYLISFLPHEQGTWMKFFPTVVNISLLLHFHQYFWLS